MFAYSLRILDKLLFPFATDLSETHASSEATWAIRRLSNFTISVQLVPCLR